MQAEYPTLYVQYAMNCTFTIVDESGKTISAIPPGTYEVEVSTPIMFKLVNTNNLAPNDFTGCKGWVQFQLTGPGVNLATTLTTGCDANDFFPAQTFQPNSTYTAQDNNQPSVAHMTFTTLPAGGPGPPTPVGPYGAGTGKGQTSGGSPLGQDVPASPAAHRVAHGNAEPDRKAHAHEQGEARDLAQSRPLQVHDHRQRPEGQLHDPVGQRRLVDRPHRDELRRQAFADGQPHGRQVDVLLRPREGLLHPGHMRRPVSSRLGRRA